MLSEILLFARQHAFGLVLLTNRPLPFEHSAKDSVDFFLVRCPVPAYQRHVHCPESPAQERNISELPLRKPSASSEHSGPDSKLLDHVEVGPFDMIGDNDRRFIFGELVDSRDGDFGAVDSCEY